MIFMMLPVPWSRKCYNAEINKYCAVPIKKSVCSLSYIKDIDRFPSEYLVFALLKAIASSSISHIADQLAIAEVTVRTHISHILSKLQLANRVQATLYALREGLASLNNNRE